MAQEERINYWTLICQQSEESLLKLLQENMASQFSSFKIQDIDLLKIFTTTVLAKVGGIPSELSGNNIRLVLGVPIVVYPNGTKMKPANVLRQQGYTFIVVFNIKTKKLINIQLFHEFMNKAHATS